MKNQIHTPGKLNKKNKNMIVKYDNYNSDEFEQMRHKLKSYSDRLNAGETLSERGAVLEFFKIYNTVVVGQIQDIGYEKMPESDCSSCTKRIKRIIDNYFLLFPLLDNKQNNNDNDGDNKTVQRRGRKPKSE